MRGETGAASGKSSFRGRTTHSKTETQDRIDVLENEGFRWLGIGET